MNFAIGIDLGGTNIRAGIVSDQGEISGRRHHSSKSCQSMEGFLAEAETLVRELRIVGEHRFGEYKGLGLGIPGIYDPKQGVLYASPNFPKWKNWPIQEALAQLLGGKIFIDNDANNIARGEAWLGAGAELNNFLLMTLGTGIGGAIVLDRKIWSGERGFAGEIGHLVVEPEGRACPCGGRGCLERYASASGIMISLEESKDSTDKRDFLKKLPGKISVDQIADLANAGDPFAVKLFKQFGYYLGIGVASLIHTLGIEHVILGGGVGGSMELFIPAVKEQIGQRVYPEVASRLQVSPAKLGEDAGLLGSTRLFF